MCFKCSRSEQLCTCIRQESGFEPFTSDRQERDCIFTCKIFCCECSFCHRVPTKKRRKSQLLLHYTEIKHVNDVSCVGHLSSANTVTNVPTVAINPPVGVRLQQFWEKWEALGSSPKVVTILREGYTLPFRFRPNLTRSPTINPQRQSHLLEALYQLTNKNAKIQNGDPRDNKDLPTAREMGHLHRLQGRIIISPDESRGYIGFRSVAPPP